MSYKYRKGSKKIFKGPTKDKYTKFSPKSPKMATQSISDFFPIEESVQKLPEIVVYTDGSTIENGKVNAKGGISVFFGDNDQRNLSEPYFLYPITNNRCEMYAAIQAIQILAKTLNTQKKHRVIIKTDSEYLVNCITKWLPTWIARGWRKADKTNVENRDLLFWLDSLIHLYQGFMEVKFKHVFAAHDRNEPKDKSSIEWCEWHGNNEADKLAKRGTEISIKLDKISGQ
jgi:ribonuclease HI